MCHVIVLATSKHINGVVANVKKTSTKDKTTSTTWSHLIDHSPSPEKTPSTTTKPTVLIQLTRELLFSRLKFTKFSPLIGFSYWNGGRSVESRREWGSEPEVVERAGTGQECVSEFISFITSEASDKCLKEKRKTINGDDLLWAMATLGFEDYIEPLKAYLIRYREIEGDTKGSGRKEGVQLQPEHDEGFYSQGLSYGDSQQQGHLLMVPMQGTDTVAETHQTPTVLIVDTTCNEPSRAQIYEFFSLDRLGFWVWNGGRRSVEFRRELEWGV
ncbi:unnamed protein product [Lactuca saligna]|uniref:Transcription factor CBF/NF-Y/archaeal histone domain-containing protein n=1 Tax=Lactuca saligna TaxID=75948 RepID=A0AA36EBQ6_LACSI|nr:unnamed protein product [Lactuca saligna]